MTVCEACGSKHIAVLLDNLSHQYRSNDELNVWRYRLLECKECGLGFVDPLPTWDLLQTFYDDDYGSYDISRVNPEQEAFSFKYRIAKLRYATIKGIGLLAIAKTLLGLLAEWGSGRTVSYTLGIPLQLDKDAQIFELGFGSGYWLLAMSALGYNNIHGYDIDANSRNAERLLTKGIQVSGGVFLENNYPPNSFDLIRLEHVFEHLENPIGVLRKCHSMLKPGGFLVMNFPCKDSWSNRLALTESPLLQLPKHLYHHTRLSARLIVQATGFVPLSLKSYSVMSVLRSTLNRLLVAHKIVPVPQRLEVILSPAYKLFGCLTKKGDFLTLWASKN